MGLYAYVPSRRSSFPTGPLTRFCVNQLSHGKGRVALSLFPHLLIIALAVSLMCLHPLFRSYSQMLGTLYYGTGQTRLHRNLALLQMGFGLALTAWLLGPSEWFGLDYGGNRTCAEDCCRGSNVRLWYGTRYLNLRFTHLLRHQLSCIVLFGLCASCVSILLEDLIGHPMVSFVACGLAHVTVCSVVVYALPGVFLTSRADIHKGITRVTRVILGSKS